MTSDIQLEANRGNAQKSTGPASEAGKAAVRFNATRHGLTSQVACMTWEDRDAFNHFCAAIAADLKPEGAIETQLAQAIAEDHWRLNRARAIEENLFALGFAESTLDAGDPQATAALSQAETFRDNLKSFNLITLYEARLNRNVQRNMDRLRQLQAERREARSQTLADIVAARAAMRSSDSQTTGSGLILTEVPLEHESMVDGFVFSEAEIALAARGQNLSALLAESTLLAAGPPKTSKSTRTNAYTEAA